jgi:RNA polymerase sigma-70 factor (ECF subfamily)
MAVDPALRDQLLGAVPSLRAFAYSLTNSWDRTDDLVQDTLTRAWGSLDRFEHGTNLNAWLFTILRNLFYSEHRKRKREVEDPDGSYAGRLRTHAEQPSHLDFADFRTALAKLPPSHCEALILVGAEGVSYEEAAAICGVAVGTIKSRVSRGREKLSKLLAGADAYDVGPDQITRAAMQPR